MTIELVDMCSLQGPGTVDFDAMKASGVRGVYFKSSQYSSSLDGTFNIGVERAEKAGLIVGAYHFAYCGKDPWDQMAFFYKASRGLGAKEGELPPMLDWEFAKNGEDGTPLKKSETVKWAAKAMAAAKIMWYPDNDRMPTLYTFPFFAYERQPWLGNEEVLGKYPLTLAAYPTLPIELPKPWNKVTIHQYVGNGGRVAGVSTDCDRDRFLGSEEDFQRFLGYREPTGNKLVPDEATTGSGPTLHVIPEWQTDTSGAV